MKKIGVFKQLFDPITLQDISFVKEQIQKLNLDEVYFIVLDDHNKVKVSDRQKMILLVLESENIMSLSNAIYIKETNNEYFNLENKESFIIHNKVMKGDFSLLDERVRNYIYSNCFYYEDIAKNNLKSHRFNHSHSVSRLAVEIAQAHNYDENKAYIAGILHDICKELPYEKTMELMNIHFKDLIDEPYYLFHAYLGMIFVRDKLFIKDEEILKAIYYHVLGNDYDTLSKIIFISDKLDPSRSYDSSHLINLTLMDLDEGFRQTKKENEEYNKEKLK